MFASTVKESGKKSGRRERTRSHLEDARRNGKAAADDLDSAAHAVGKDVRDFIENAIESASESLSQAKEKLSDTTDSITHRVRIKPLSSIAIAAGVGLVLGALLRRR